MVEAVAQPGPAVLTSRTRSAGILGRAAARSDKKLQVFRDKRKELMMHIAGPHYGKVQDEQYWRQVLSTLYMVQATLEPALAMPRVLTDVTTVNPGLNFFAQRLKQVMDHTLEKMRVQKTMRYVIRDTLVGMGVTVCGYDETREELTGQGFFCDPVSLDDYIIDGRSKQRQPMSYAYEGHRFRMDWEKGLDSGLFKGQARTVFEGLLHAGRPTGERAQSIATHQDYDPDDEFAPQVELVQLYIPDERRIVWLPGDLETSSVELRSSTWYGDPDDPFGPYDVLGFNWLNDNLMPVPLLMAIFDLYILENALGYKIGEQQLSQKNIVATQDKSDGDIIRKSPDSNVVVLSDTDKTKELRLGGADKSNFDGVGWFHDWLNRIAGNPEIIGGQGADSETLGQDQLKLGQAGQRLADMKGQVYEVASSIARKARWYVWEDPDYAGRFAVEHRGESFPFIWHPNYREGMADDYQVKVNAYGRPIEDPTRRAEAIMTVLERVQIPLAPLAAQQGSRLDVDALSNALGTMLDLPEMQDIWVEAPPLDMPAQAMAGPGGQQQGMGMQRSPGGKQPQRPIEAMATKGAV